MFAATPHSHLHLTFNLTVNHYITSISYCQQADDGYHFAQVGHIYSPKSVVSAMLSGCFDSYWNQTETFEALRDYIAMNFDGLKDKVVELLAGIRKKINIKKFTNDMTTFNTADDVLTLLIHLGYLGYDYTSQEVFIPNSEIAAEFCNAIEGAGWDSVVKAVGQSERLLIYPTEKSSR